jgi:hydroxymethylpyrimidine pyrophosphatase-like HAD family hydrolase
VTTLPEADAGGRGAPKPETVPAGPGFFHAVAIDFDGTLTLGGHPEPETLAALDEARAAGRLIILVTGRILAELLEVFPDVVEHTDAIVAENGAVLVRDGRQRALATPVPAELATALETRGVAVRRGQVLLACAGTADTAVLNEVRRLGLDCQLVRNRGELMILPAGLSKGTGLVAGLAELGVSAHSVAAIGDAENDHSLLLTAELGVAVGNAVAALKAGADVVLAERDGRGVRAFLRGQVIGGTERRFPRRWRVMLGRSADGGHASIPASQVNVLVTGVPQHGKSYLGGLIAEQLIRLGYSVVIMDPEGDHAGLGALGNVLVTSGAPPAADVLASMVRHHAGGIVVDLSALGAQEKVGYLESAHRALERERASTGLPHWLVIDEAQVPLARDTATLFEPAATGYCLITHRPQDLRPEALLAVDVLITVPGGEPDGRAADLIAAAGAMPHAAAAALLARAGPGQAVLVRRDQPGTGLVFSIGRRETAHMRHWHKYTDGQLSAGRRFYFRRTGDTTTGTSAGNVGELERELRTCDDATIEHHCGHADFSRWVAEVLGDPPLAAAMADIEQAVTSGTAGTAQGRDRFVSVIQDRYRDG